MTRRPLVLASLLIASIAFAAPVLAAPGFVGYEPQADLPRVTDAALPLPAESPLVAEPQLPTGSARPDLAPDVASLDAPHLADAGATDLDGARGVDLGTDAEAPGAASEATLDAEGPSATRTASSMAAPLHWNGSGNSSYNHSWNKSQWNFSVEAGNFSWKGINCSWEALNWTWGSDPFANLSITCDFWGLFTVTIQNGTVTVNWTNGSWNWSFMPAMPLADLIQAPSPTSEAELVPPSRPSLPSLSLSW